MSGLDVLQGGAVKGLWLLVIAIWSCRTPDAGDRREPPPSPADASVPLPAPALPRAPDAQSVALPAEPSAGQAPPVAMAAEEGLQLPDEWTRTAPKNVLKRGDRLIAGNNDGLFELTWWGKRKKPLSEHAVRAVRWWDERTLVYVDEAVALRKFDLAMATERQVARLPGQFACKDLAPLEWGEISLVLDREADVVCVRSQVDRAQVAVAAGVASGVLRMRVKCANGRTRGPKIACVETGSRAENPAIDAPEEPTEAHLPLPDPEFPIRIEVLDKRRLALLRRGRDGVEHRLATVMATAGPISPSGRWQPLKVTNGWILLERSNGRFTPLQAGPWPAPFERQAWRTALVAATAGEPEWLPHSDLLLLGNLVVVPGVGGYRPGVVAR